MIESPNNSLMSGRPVAGAEPALLVFLKAKVNTFVKWDLVHFFHTNPHTADTAEHLARYIGRDPDDVAAQLSELAGGGMVEMQTVGGLPMYALTEEPEARELMARFVEACRDQQFRTQAIYHLVRAAKG